MPYVYLSFFLVTNLLFVNLLRFAQKRRIEIFTTLAINYWIAAAVSVAAFLWEANRGTPLVPSLIGLGITNGLIYFIHLVIVLKAYRIAGTGITVALVQSASVVPMIASWLLWRNEVMTPGRWIAASLIPVAMALMRPSQSVHGPLTLKANLILLLTFAGAGLSQFLHKAADVTAGTAGTTAYQVHLFTFAAISSTIYVLVHRRRLKPSACLLGGAAGLANALTTRMLLLSLSGLGAVVFFSTAGPLLIVLALIVARILWQERIIYRQKLGVATAIAIVVLTHMA